MNFQFVRIFAGRAEVAPKNGLGCIVPKVGLKIKLGRRPCGPFLYFRGSFFAWRPVKFLYIMGVYNFMNMNIQIKTKGGLTVTDAINDYVAKRCESLEKFVANDPTVFVVVELERTTEHHKHGDIFKAEIHVTGKTVGQNGELFVSAEREDLYAAIDAVRDEALRELSSAKSRRTTLVRRGGAKVKNMIKGFFN
jgi:ribosomal subunit interface protein